MTLDDLRERIKDEVVLHEGDVAEWQWRQMGLPAEAAELGLSAADFSRLVNQVSQSIAPDLPRISDVKTSIQTLARQRNKQLSERDIQQIVTDAERARLTRAFVVDTWLPAILATIPDSPTASSAMATPAADPLTNLGQTTASAGVTRQKIRQILAGHDQLIPAGVLRSIFVAIDDDPQRMADEVVAYLSEQHFAAVNPPQGDTLKDKLLSTDWKHLSSWADAPYRDMLTKEPVVPPRPAAVTPPPSQNRPVSLPPQAEKGLPNWAVLLLAVLGAVGILWLVWLGVSDRQATREPTSIASDTTPAKRTKPKKNHSATGKSKTKRTHSESGSNGTIDLGATVSRNNEPTAKPDTPYDEIERAVGQYGERRASQGSKWGLWRKKDWMILPIYDDITLFSDGRATVLVNNRSYEINRQGERVE